MVTTGQLTTWDDVLRFMFAGSARFTLVSRRTGFRFTYRVKVKLEEAETADPTYFVSLLRGSDNESDYAYMGVLRNSGQFNFTSNSRVQRTAQSSQALLWFLDKLRQRRNVLGDLVEFWHEGRCGRCGRGLTVPESIAQGLGPECAVIRAEWRAA